MKITLIVAGIFCAAAGVLYYFIFTTSGSQFVAGRILSEYAAPGDASYKNVEGNLGNGITFRDLELNNIRNLPEGTTLKIQRLHYNITSLSIGGVSVEAENVRLKLPGSDPVVIAGTLKERQLDFNVYSKGFTVTEVLSYLPDFKKLVPVKGEVNDIDLFITGDYREPLVRGSFVIGQFVYKGFLLTGAPLAVDMRLKDIQNEIKLYGTVSLKEGVLQTKRASVSLGNGALTFDGPRDQPRINFNGTSNIEKTKITISLKGTADKPELTLTSEPPYPQQKLMVMLATGKSWQSVEDSVDNGLNSAALAKDFIDYFFFAGKSNQFAKRFGISDFSVTYDQNSQGIAAKKEITDKLEVGYGIEQKKENGQAGDVTQKLGGELKVNDRVSVGVEREIQQKKPDGLTEEAASENNDKVLLKYKKSF